MIGSIRLLLAAAALCGISLAESNGPPAGLPREYTEILLTVDGMV